MEITETLSQRKAFLRLVIAVGLITSVVFGMASCNLPNLSGIIPANQITGNPEETQIISTPEPSPTPMPPQVRSLNLVLWVPPQLDPNLETTAGNLFLSRLDEFRSNRSGTDIQVRVKELDSEFGLLESLQLTESAAPLLTPDLIALPRSLMEQAYLENLILPLSEYLSDETSQDWYGYADELARIEDQFIGLPLGGDLMVLAYKNDAGELAPPDWDAILESQKALAFPASDPKALVTLGFYESLEGELQDQDGSYQIEPEPMLQVLNFYQNAQAAGVMPYWLTQFESDLQAWDSYQERQSTLAVTWSSTILTSDSPNTSLASIPTKEGRAFSYADGWVWCLVKSDPDTQIAAVELAQFLTAEPFLSTWGLEAGYLPLNPKGLEAWENEPYYSTLGQILPPAKLIPDDQTLADLGPQIQAAVVAVLKDQVEPEQALADLVGALE